MNKPRRPAPTRLPRATASHNDLTRTTLGVLCIAGLILAAFWVLRPFIGPAIWAAMIVVATWPLMRRLQARLWNSRPAAVAVMTLALLILFVLPVALITATLVQNTNEISAAIKQLSQLRMPTAPDWLAALPLVGERIRVFWETTVAAGSAELWPHVQPYAGQVARWMLAQVGGVGFLLAQGLLLYLEGLSLLERGELSIEGLKL